MTRRCACWRKACLTCGSSAAPSTRCWRREPSSASICIAPATGSASAPATCRPLALSYGSRLIFGRLGIGAALAVTAIERIVVSQVGSFGRTRLDAAEAGVPALGYQTDYAALLGALRSPLGDTLVSEPPEARCIVHAEGAPAEIAGKRYEHEVLVALLSSEPAAASTAFERFTDEGPLALLPLGERY